MKRIYSNLVNECSRDDKCTELGYRLLSTGL